MHCTTTRSRLTVFGVVVGVVICSYLYVDRALALFFYDLHGPVKVFFQDITDFGNGKWYIVPSLLLYLLFRRYGKSLYARYALYLFTSNVASGMAVWIVKALCGRYRPRLFLANGDYGFTGFGYAYNVVSFPSGHAITIMTTMTALALLFPRLSFPLGVSGLLIAMSRVVTTHHYFSDVVMGSYMGIVCAVHFYQRMVTSHPQFGQAAAPCASRPSPGRGIAADHLEPAGRRRMPSAGGGPCVVALPGQLPKRVA